MFFSNKKSFLDDLKIYEEKRPWGGFRRFTLYEKTTVKIITVSAGQAFSLQHHANRSEFWRILSGKAAVTVGNDTKEGKAGDEFFISAGSLHRLEAIEETQFLEIAFGNFDEQDIVRIKDNYGRA